jgi:uncharacterized protein YecE (DUF72 family)
MAKKLYIGTSGWHYKHWLGPFYPEGTPTKEMLAYYLQYFDTVELNNSFYRLPKPAALKSWRDSVPKDFLYAAKASRFITHMKKLKDPKKPLRKVIPRLEYLKEKLGPILFQLPGGWNCNPERLGEFLDALPTDHKYAFEFRNQTWHNSVVYDLLRQHNCAFVIYEFDRFISPAETTADFTYFRLHGPEGKYQGDYSKEKLTIWANLIRKLQQKVNQVYVYFDNDQAGYAAKNALELKKMLKTK